VARRGVAGLSVAVFGSLRLGWLIPIDVYAYSRILLAFGLSASKYSEKAIRVRRSVGFIRAAGERTWP